MGGANWVKKRLWEGGEIRGSWICEYSGIVETG